MRGFFYNGNITMLWLGPNHWEMSFPKENPPYRIQHDEGDHRWLLFKGKDLLAYRHTAQELLSYLSLLLA